MIAQKVAIVILALNEEAALRRLLAELPRNFAQWIIVVDNGSTDATAAVAQDAGVMVASEPTQGYGLACLKGFKFTIAIAVMAAPRWLAHSSAASRQLTTCFAQQCAM